VKLLDAEEIPAPIVHVEKDMVVLVDDVLLLLERAAICRIMFVIMTMEFCVDALSDNW